MNYPDSVSFLYALGNELKTAKFGLERIERLMRELGSPHVRPRRFIHVAGTNGKGSTCAMIESGLRASGFRTGMFTSPHLIEPTERIRIDGVPVSTADFTRAFDRVHVTAEALMESGEIDLHPSYFETVTAMAFVLFAEARVDVTVLEVGLGGRLDATNIVEPELCVITPVDFDHEKFLGTSLESIAMEKAGILKAGVPAVLAAQRPEADAVIRARARELGAIRFPHSPPDSAAAIRELGLQTEPRPQGSGIDAAIRELGLTTINSWPPEQVEVDRFGSRILAHGLTLECRLRGRHQIGNALTAATALSVFGANQTVFGANQTVTGAITGESIERGIRDAQWPGRLQRLPGSREIIVDGAHNPAGARALAAYVAEFYADPKPVLIFGAMRDKAVEEMAGILFPHFREVIVTAPGQARALAPETFQGMVEHPSVRSAPDLRTALASVTEPDSVVFVSGSLFLVAEAMQLPG